MATRRRPPAAEAANGGGTGGLPVRPRAVSLDAGGAQLARLRSACLALPQVNERLGHGAPCFYADKKIFAMYSDNHHGDGRLAAWLKAPPGAQAMLLETSPEAGSSLAIRPAQRSVAQTAPSGAKAMQSGPPGTSWMRRT